MSVFIGSNTTISYDVIAVGRALKETDAADEVVVGFDNDDDFYQGRNGKKLNVSLVDGCSIKGNLNVNAASTVHIRGGRVNGRLEVYNLGTVNLSGGTIMGDLYVYGSGVLNLFGTGLETTLINPDAADRHYSYSRYILEGALSNGTDLFGKFLYVENNSRASFTLNNTPRPVQPRRHSPAR